MNRSLRKRHARLWLILWPILLVGLLLAIQTRTDTAPTLQHSKADDSQ